MSVPTTRERRFVLRLLPTAAGDNWGFTLAETIGDSSQPVARVNPARAVGYRRAVVLNLAVELAPEYGAKNASSGLSAQTVRQAMRSKRILKNRNIGVLEAKIDPMLNSHGYSSQLYRRGVRGYYR